MKITRTARLGALAIAAVALVSIAHSQPSLSPPAGPIVESGRWGLGTALSLDNTPGDSDSFFKITQPGSYYLTDNLMVTNFGSAIEIEADNVVLDLNGFTVQAVVAPPQSVPVTERGVWATGENVVIRNGTTREFRRYGVLAEGALARVEQIHAIGNGGPSGDFDLGWGIETGEGGAVVRCTASANLSIGISVRRGSSVIDCVAYQNANVGIIARDSLVAHCSAFDNPIANIDIGTTASTLVGNHAP